MAAYLMKVKTMAAYIMKVILEAHRARYL